MEIHFLDAVHLCQFLSACALEARSVRNLNLHANIVTQLDLSYLDHPSTRMLRLLCCAVSEVSVSVGECVYVTYCHFSYV